MRRFAVTLLIVLLTVRASFGATATSILTAGVDYPAFNGALGTPSSGTLTSCTGLPVATGISNLGTGVATALATPSSANIAAACTDETGSGLLVFATSPTFTTGATITGGTVSANAPALNITQTYNNSGVAFNTLSLAVTNTASAGTSTPITLSVGGSTVYSVGLTGTISSTGTFQTFSSTNITTQVGANGVCLASDYPIKWNSVLAGAGGLFSSGNFETGFWHGNKTLVESTATSLVRIAVASGAKAGGTLHYVIDANDATDTQTRSGTVPFAIVNKAGTLTAALGTPVEIVAVSAGTLTVTIDTNSGASNTMDLRANAVSSLTQTTLACRWWIDLSGPTASATAQ